MSFSLNLNSINGTRIITNSINQVEYDFAFDKTPEHKGAYLVYMTFLASPFELNPFDNFFPDMYVNANLGRYDSYTPIGLYAGSQNNQVLGVVQLIQNNVGVTVISPTESTKFIGTTAIPINSGTVAYTQTTSTASPTSGSYMFDARRLECGSFYYQNPPVRLNTKPTGNKFIVTLTNADGSLHTAFTTAAAPWAGGAFYSIILTFEAI